jgi:hypothetical protein
MKIRKTHTDKEDKTVDVKFRWAFYHPEVRFYIMTKFIGLTHPYYHHERTKFANRKLNVKRSWKNIYRWKYRGWNGVEDV